MKTRELKKQVKSQLEEKFDYDFLSEFWTNDNLTMLDEVIETTQEVIANNI